MFYLLLREYAPRKFFALTWAYGIMCVISIVFISISRFHYTVDIGIAYWVTTRTFWIYHSLATNSTLKVNLNRNRLVICKKFNIKLLNIYIFPHRTESLDK